MFDNGSATNRLSSFQQGDILGVKLVYEDGKGTLTYYKNAQSIGQAFTDLPLPLYPAVRMMRAKLQVSIVD